MNTTAHRGFRTLLQSVTLLCALAASACQVEEPDRNPSPSSWRGSGRACSNTGDCPMGEECSADLCRVPGEGSDNGNGNGNGNIPDAGPGCLLDTDCAPGDVCQNGACQPQSGGNASTGGSETGCVLDSDCAAGEKCENGTCTLANPGGGSGGGTGGLTCSSDVDCGAGEKCYSGSCIPDDGT